MNSWIIENLGWTLLHSLWQIGFVALVLFMALRVLRDFSANLRYTVSVSALILSLILPVTTFVYLSTTTNPVQTAKQPLPTISKPILTQETKSQIIAETVDVPPIVLADNSVLSPSPKIPYLTILVVFWLIGVTIFAVRLVGGIWTVHLYKTRQVSEVESHWQTKFDKLCESLQIKRKVRFLKSQMVEMPVVIGWLKPVVLVPASAFLQISPKELETILLHELTHIKRHDYLVNFGQSLVEILFFYHPCVWWISAKIRAEREFAVDEFVSQVFETERFVYAKALATLEEIRSVPIPTLAMAANGGNLMKRIENILNGSRKINSKNISIWSAVFAVTLILGVAVGVYWIKSSSKVSGRKIAVVYGMYPAMNKGNYLNNEFFSILEKHQIPVTWVINQFTVMQMMKDESAKSVIRDRYNKNIKFAIDTRDTATGSVIPEDTFEDFSERHLNYLNEVLSIEGGKTDYFYFLDGFSQYRSAQAQNVEKTFFSKGMKNIPFATPNYDSLFTLLYDKICIAETNKFPCEQDFQSKKAVQKKYLRFMTDQFDKMQNYSQEVMGREIPQILLLSSSKLNDESADQIFQILKDKGYEFVSLEEVLTDETYIEQEKIRKLMRFDRNRWDATAEYLKDELHIVNVPLKSDKSVEGKIENGKVTIKTK